MTDAQKWLFLVLLLVSGWLIYLLAPVLMPFAFAAMLAYLGDPLADRLEVIEIKNYQLGRTNAVVVVFAIMSFIIATVLGIVIPRVELQISQLIANFPVYVKWLNDTVIPWIELQTKLDIGLI